MGELIRINKHDDGTQTVSARELYGFLGFDYKNWARWYSKNIEKNKFAVQGIDFEPVVIVKSAKSEGNFAKDFALTIDFAKKLAMLSRTDKGEEARDYFIAVEKQFKQATSLSPAEMLLQSVKLLVEQEKKIAEHATKINVLDERLSLIENSKEKFENEVLSLPKPDEFQIPEKTTRTILNKYIQYVGKITDTDFQTVWNVLYSEWDMRYKMNVKLRAYNKGIKPIDYIESINKIGELYYLAKQKFKV